MIAITGMYRAGANVPMQIMVKHGVPVMGQKFPFWVTPFLQTKDPNGRYECAETAGGIKGPIGKTAVNITLDALMNLSITGPNDLIILCQRGRAALAQSQKDYDELFAPWPSTWSLAQQDALNQRFYLAFENWIGARPLIRLTFENWATDPVAAESNLIQQVQAWQASH